MSTSNNLPHIIQPISQKLYMHVLDHIRSTDLAYHVILQTSSVKETPLQAIFIDGVGDVGCSYNVQSIFAPFFFSSNTGNILHESEFGIKRKHEDEGKRYVFTLTDEQVDEIMALCVTMQDVVNL